MNALKRLLEDKNDFVGAANGGRKPSSFNVTVLAFATAWIFRFTADIVVVFIAVLGKRSGASLADLPTVSEPMAWLGACILFAKPLNELFGRVRAADAAGVLQAFFRSLGSAKRSPGGVLGGDNRYEDDERGGGEQP